MADVTLLCRAQVPRWFTGGAAAIAVTAVTIAGSAGIMHPAATDKGGCAVAEMAVQRG